MKIKLFIAKQCEYAPLLAGRRASSQLLYSVWLFVVLAGCSGQSEAVKAPVLTGHFEGPVTYQGSDLRVVLDVRETTPGQLQADMHFPEIAGISFPVANLRYKEPQLHFEQQPGQPGSITVSAIREGDFLRGIFTWDTIQTEFVWVRRGQAAPRLYREQSVRLPTRPKASLGTLLIPQDTALRYPAVVLIPDNATAGAATTRADLLARHGFVVLLTSALPVPATPDSTAFHLTMAALAACRAEASVDSSRVGVWVRGGNGQQVAQAASLATPAAAFVVLEGVPVTTAAAASVYQQLARQHLPLLGLYGAADTTVQAAESARRLRGAIAYQRHEAVRTYAKANRNLTVAGTTDAKGQWQWPQPAPGYINDLLVWLREQTTK